MLTLAIVDAASPRCVARRYELQAHILKKSSEEGRALREQSRILRTLCSNKCNKYVSQTRLKHANKSDIYAA